MSRCFVLRMSRFMLSLIITLSSSCTFAYETAIIGGIEWKYTVKDGKAIIGDDDQAYFSAVPKTVAGTLEIPAKICGLPVDRVGRYAFNNCYLLKSVVIPKSVVEIGSCAFFACEALESVSISDGVKVIEDEAFRGCASLRNLSIPGSVRAVGQSVCLQCSSLEAVSLCVGLPEIPFSMFAHCYSLKSISIPQSVTNIGAYAFQNCESLESIEIPYGVTTIAQQTFHNCYALRSVVIPSSVSTIGLYAFEWCKSLGGVKIPTSVKTIDLGAFYYCSSLASVEIPGGVSIGSWAFKYCSSLESIGFTEGTTEIGNVMSNFMAIKEVTIPRSVTNVVRGAFASCKDLEIVNISDLSDWCKIEFASEDANPLCHAKKLVLNGAEIVDLVVPDDVSKIGRYAFCNYVALRSIMFPSGLSGIGYGAFNGCSKLSSVTIPEGVTAIEECAFSGCSGIESFYVDEANPAYSSRNGLLCSKDGRLLLSGVKGDVVIPESVVSFGEGAFLNCQELKSIIIPLSVLDIGDGAFSGCIGMELFYVDELNPSYSSRNGLLCSKDGNLLLAGVKGDVVIPNGIKCIADVAFYGNSNLTAVTIPSSVTNIGANTFKGCSELMFVTMPPCVTKLSAAFPSAYMKIKDVVICEGATRVDAEAFRYCDGLRSVFIPSSVKSVGQEAFSECASLRTVIISEGVEGIGWKAFNGCRGLTSLTIPTSVTSLGSYAFEGCCGLTSVKIPSSVKRIGFSVFSDCDSLQSVVIEDGVTGIDDAAFNGCTMLKSVKIPFSMNEISKSSFGGCSGLSVVYVEEGDIERVKGLCEWPSNVKFVEFVAPVVDGDLDAVVTGDVETGFVVKPSEAKRAVEVSIPQVVDAAKVTVEVSPKVVAVKPNGATVKVVVDESDITGFLVIPESEGVLNIAAATVREEIVKETLDPSKDAVIELNAANPRLITAPTRKGLTYTLFEGRKLESLSKGDSKVGDGDPWKPAITVSGGDAAFYSIDVSK